MSTQGFIRRASWFSLIGTAIHSTAALLAISSALKRASLATLDEPFEVLIPAYNAAPTISAALISIDASARLPSRVVVIDDGSSDETAVIVASYALRSSVPIVLVQRPHGGKADALNHGLSLVKARIVICCDADTEVQSDAFERLVTRVRDGVVAVSANRRRLEDMDNARPGYFDRCLALDHAVNTNATRLVGNLVGKQLTLSGPLSAYDVAALRAVGGFPKAMAEDTSVTLLLNRLGRVIYEPDAVVMTALPVGVAASAAQHDRWLVGTWDALTSHFVAVARRQVPLDPVVTYFVGWRVVIPTLITIEELLVAARPGWADKYAAVRFVARLVIQVTTGRKIAAFDGSSAQTRDLVVINTGGRYYLIFLAARAVLMRIRRSSSVRHT